LVHPLAIGCRNLPPGRPGNAAAIINARSRFDQISIRVWHLAPLPEIRLRALRTEDPVAPRGTH
jgi:hypothetical protein